MVVADVIHRLRLRANNAAAEGQVHLAADLRLAIATLQELEREAALARRPATPSREETTAANVSRL